MLEVWCAEIASGDTDLGVELSVSRAFVRGIFLDSSSCSRGEHPTKNGTRHRPGRPGDRPERGTGEGSGHTRLCLMFVPKLRSLRRTLLLLLLRVHERLLRTARKKGHVAFVT